MPTNQNLDLIAILSTPEAARHVAALRKAAAEAREKFEVAAASQSGLDKAQTALESTRSLPIRLEVDLQSRVAAAERQQRQAQNELANLAKQITITKNAIPAAKNISAALAESLEQELCKTQTLHAEAAKSAHEASRRLDTVREQTKEAIEEAEASRAKTIERAQADYAQAKTKFEELRSAYCDPQAELLCAVEAAIEERRRRDFHRLMGLLGDQSRADLLAEAASLDLGPSYTRQLEIALRERGSWVRAITPRGRELASELAKKRSLPVIEPATGRDIDFHLPDRTKFILLRAEHIIGLNQEGAEVSRITLSPEGLPYKARQQTRTWRIGRKDVWVAA
jgi:hypothetical protein